MSDNLPLSYPSHLGAPTGLKDSNNEEYAFLTAIHFTFAKRVSENSRVPSDQSDVYLYMPLSARNGANVQWDQADINMQKRIMESLLTGQAISDMKNLYSGLTSMSGDSLKRYVTSSVLGRGDIARLTPNPHLKMMFKGLGMRSFEYQFKFTPKNRKESTDIDNIITKFRQAALPDYAGPADNSKFYLSWPEEIDIEYLQYSTGNDISSIGVERRSNGYRTIPWMNRFKSCVITSLDVDYTSGGHYVPMRDGFPAETTLTMQFTETTLVTRSDVARGF